MTIFYFCNILIIYFLAFFKSKINRFLLFYFNALVILLLSVRSQPDEYARVLKEVPTKAFNLFNYGLFGEPFFHLIAYFANITFNPLFSLYLICYVLIFYCLTKSSYLLNKDWGAVLASIAFYLSHTFISYAFTGISGALANAISTLGLIFLLKNKYFLGIVILFTSSLIHLQTVLFSIVTISTLLIFKNKNSIKSFLINSFKKIPIYIWIIFFIFILIISQFLRDVFGTLVSNFLLNDRLLNPVYFLYFAFDDKYGYTIDILSLNFIASLSFPIIIIVLLIIFSWKRVNIIIKHLAIIISFSPIIMLLFSTSAVYAFRLASPFNTCLAPLIGTLWLKSNHSSKSQLLTVRSIIVFYSLLLVLYNLVILERLNDYQL